MSDNIKAKPATENQVKAVASEIRPSFASKVQSNEKTFEESLIEYLDNADAQIKIEKKNKEQRAIDALFFLNGCLDNFKKSGKVTLLAKLIERSEFSGLMRMIVANVVVNMSISGRGKNLTLRCVDENGKKQAPQWVTPAKQTLSDFAHPNYGARIDDTEVKEAFGIPMGDEEKVEKAIETIKGLKKRKIDGDPILDLLPLEMRNVLDHLIALATPDGNVES